MGNIKIPHEIRETVFSSTGGQHASHPLFFPAIRSSFSPQGLNLISFRILGRERPLNFYP
jgi:hypothetical protein